VIGDADLADVVERARHADQFAALGTQAHPVCHQRAVMAHPLDVPRALVVAELGGERQPLDRLILKRAHLALRLLELRDVVPHLAGPRSDHLLEPARVRTGLYLRATAAHRARDVDKDFVVLERFDDVAVGAGLDRSLCDRRIVGARDHHRRHVGIVAGDLHQEVETGPALEVHVGEHHLEGLALEELEGLARGAGGDTGISLAIEELDQVPADRVVVFDDQRAHRTGRFRPESWHHVSIGQIRPVPYGMR
jgi:hypothetical protein